MEKHNKISFPSFIALSREFDRGILEDSKLLCLLIYIAVRVARKTTSLSFNMRIVTLRPGEFVIGRLSTAQNTDLSEQEYKSRFRKLQRLKVIKVVKPTNHYTIGQWLENSFIDLNIPPANQPADNQQSPSNSTTNNNLSLFINSHLFKNTKYTHNTYIDVLNGYMVTKGIKLQGEEMKIALRVIEKMFKSDRNPKDIINLMKWFQKHQNNEQHPWVRNWNISTVHKKLPEFLAGKLKIRTMDDDYEYIK